MQKASGYAVRRETVETLRIAKRGRVDLQVRCRLGSALSNNVPSSRGNAATKGSVLGDTNSPTRVGPLSEVAKA